jgi:hypothetical protein
MRAACLPAWNAAQLQCRTSSCSCQKTSAAPSELHKRSMHHVPSVKALHADTSPEYCACLHAWLEERGSCEVACIILVVCGVTEHIVFIV